MYFVSKLHGYYQSCIYSPNDVLVSCLKNNIKVYIKISIKTALTWFGVTVTPSSGSALISAIHDDGCTATLKHVGAVLM